MTILNKTWKVKNNEPGKNAVQKLLENRNLHDPKDVKSYLETNYKKGLHNPFLMKDMEKAVARIKKAIEENERIMIFGDYDVDGISGTAILVHTLKRLGARVSYRLPHRVEDGYGLSMKFIDDFIKLGVKLAITVDCGISCKEQIIKAKDNHIDVIITDHHTIPAAFPHEAYAILHPLQPGCEYPFKGLTGAGVAYKLASALLTDALANEERENYLFSLLDLASLGTVADLGPLQNENRVIVKYGLEALQKTKWFGLHYLKKYSGIEDNVKLDVSVIGYRIGPRINAAGRIDHPYYALQLLLHDKEDEKLKLLADHLEHLNQKRQQMVITALKELEDDHLPQQKDQKVLVAWSANWHVGILGLLASRAVERHSRPCIALQDFGTHLVASARSPESFNMVQALTHHQDFLDHFGGHAQAAGFNIKKEKLAGFIDSLNSYASTYAIPTESNLTVDCELLPDEINPYLMGFLEQMQPYGLGNEQPLFLMKNVRPEYVKKVGKEKSHLHFYAQFMHEGKTQNKGIPVIAFKFGEQEKKLQQARSIDLACHLSENEWQGKRTVQLQAIDINEN